MAELVNAGGWRDCLKPLKQTAVPCGFESHSSVFHYSEAHFESAEVAQGHKKPGVKSVRFRYRRKVLLQQDWFGDRLIG